MDREKVIEQLIDLKERLKWQADIKGYGYHIETIDDAISMLKEQEKAKVVFGRCKDGSFVTECGHCGMYLDKAYSICPKCNRELDWNSNQD